MHMQRVFLLTVMSSVSLGLLGCSSQADQAGPLESAATDADAVAVVSQTVEAGCGSCTYKMDGVEVCELAVKIDGKPYLVEGSDVDAHEAGLCETTKQAEVAGKIQQGKFVATAFELLSP